jgi:hypothetical protein
VVVVAPSIILASLRTSDLTDAISQTQVPFGTVQKHKQLLQNE